MEIQNTSNQDAHYLKILVYGHAGSGKTYLCSTASKPLILSAEAGLLSLREFSLPYIQIQSLRDIMDAYEHVQGSKDYEWLILDSISEVAEVVLAYEKGQTKDPRKAYGALLDQMMELLRAFRDLPINVLMTAKLETREDDGRLLAGPGMPGQKLGQQLPYLFDEVACLRVERNTEGEVERWLQFESDGRYIAKDRSGALAAFEPPNLGQIQQKILGETNA